MLRIQPMVRYNVPKYPQNEFRQKPPDFILKLIVKGILPVTILPLLQGCDLIEGTGHVDGGLIEPPKLSEAEAKPIIESVFITNGIQLDKDISVAFMRNDTTTVHINLDGYNDSLRVGYEYMNYDEYDSLDTWDIREITEEAINDSGPYVKSIHEWYEENSESLDEYVQTFIDSLRSQGII